MTERLVVENLDADAVAKGLADGRYLLVDVREDAEYAAEHIEGAVPFPLSAFDPDALPDAAGKAIVFQCGSGVRSARAAEAAIAAGVPAGRHLAGGIAAWKRAGLPTVR